MTLGEFMAQADNDTTFYVGAQSAFIFIGNRAKYYRDVEKIDKGIKELWKRKVSLAKKDLKEHALIPRPGLPEKREEYDRRMLQLTNRLLDAKRCRKECKTLSDREIKTIFNKTIDAGKALIIEGEENGRYWFEYEYDSKKIAGELEVAILW